jgi:Uma2 family endonuclease
MNDDVLIADPEMVEIMTEYNYEKERGKPMPNLLHGTLQSQIVFLLRLKYDEQLDFPTEVTLDLDPAVTPDICIYPKRASFDRLGTPAKEPDVPITTIEIISPSQSFNTVARKIRQVYFPAGVKSAWIVVPELRGIHLLLPDDNNLYVSKGILTDPATGIELSVDKIFERVV